MDPPEAPSQAKLYKEKKNFKWHFMDQIHTDLPPIQAAKPAAAIEHATISGMSVLYPPPPIAKDQMTDG
jgi:hypothetical protein